LEDDGGAVALVREIEEGFRGGELFQWGIERREGGGLIGTATLWRWDMAHGRAELGYALGREAWGCGYMVEALVALLGRAFGEWGVRRLEADTDPRNRRSLRLLERLGFRREGYMRERFLVGGELQDSVVLGLLGWEWRGGGVRVNP
jgi:RimJ/RimL family protein N-acetyltransferase